MHTAKKEREHGNTLNMIKSRNNLVFPIKITINPSTVCLRKQFLNIFTNFKLEIVLLSNIFTNFKHLFRERNKIICYSNKKI